MGNALDDRNDKESGTINHVLYVELSCLMKKYMPINHLNKQLEEYLHDKHELWRMAYVKAEGTTISELLEIKNNSLFLPEPKYVQTFDIFGNIKDDPEEFYKHYQQLASTIEEQKQHLEEINTQLCFMPKRAHDTDTGFDLRYPGKEAIKLEPNLHTCIDLKIALKILATIMVQLASRNSLAKKGINIIERIIDTGYVENIIVMLQNDSEKAYIIGPNKKITQAIFLLLEKIAQLVSVGNREELEITTRRIQEFGSMGKIDILVNMVKEEAQLFETEATICESGEIGLTNLYISVKSPKNIKIPIYNTTGSVIEIPKGTIIGYLTTEVENQPPNHIPDFP
ncbi:hypothetical protein G9A89_009281 [Geosiphon pyriformis]|nr:hypothetical protein G9A89_009281 [Geosiphon pyriformis]